MPRFVCAAAAALVLAGPGGRATLTAQQPEPDCPFFSRPTLYTAEEVRCLSQVHKFRLPGGEIPNNDIQTLPVLADFNPRNFFGVPRLEGWALAICFPAEQATFEGAEVAPAFPEEDRPYDYVEIDRVEGGIVAGALVDRDAIRGIPAARDLLVLSLDVGLLGEVGDRFDLEICQGIGDVAPVFPNVVVDGSVFYPEANESNVYIVTRAFVRGDSDGTTNVESADFGPLMRYIVGNATTDCEDALDVNDDGRINVSDAVALILALFLQNRTIPTPFPESGGDPTVDGLLCRRL